MRSSKRVVKQPTQERERVLTQAVINAADIMGLKQVGLADVLGVSESSVSRMKSGAYLLKADHKEWELAALLVRLFRGLDAIMAGDERALRSWLEAYNTALRDAPINLIGKVTGLTRAVDYVDAYRARV